MVFDEVGLFRGEDYAVNQYITLHQPTLKEIFDFGEQEYWNFISVVCATPSDFKHQLFDGYGLYFNEVDEFDLFCMFAGSFDKQRSQLIFGDLDFQKLSIRENKDTNLREIFDENSGLVIDKMIYTIITEYLRKLNGLKRNHEVPGTEGTRDWLIEESRDIAKDNKDKEFKSFLMPIISALVNCGDFKYDYFNVWNLPIYAFLDSLKRIQHMKNIGYLMNGIYSGNILAKNIKKKELDWFCEM